MIPGYHYNIIGVLFQAIIIILAPGYHYNRVYDSRLSL